jgi:cytochrome c oxidase subunit 3
VLPPAFAISTLLLTAVSALLERALWCVRRERQRSFRRALAAALVAGAAFTSSQAWGLSWLRVSGDPSDESAGVNQFVFLFAALHAVHVCVAILFLVFVNVQAHSDRYDHEYHWGVRFCAWFWHALGIIWLVILGIFGVASGFLYG